MFTFDTDGFLAAYRTTFPDPALTAEADAGLNTLLDALAQDPDVTDARWAAYMLATVKHECANTWRPIEEFGKGRGHPYGEPVTIVGPDGTQYTNAYFGRGYVQLTWRLNYANMGQKLGLANALVLHPDHALEPATAYAVMSYGMRHGSFTGVGLHRYIFDNTADYFNARRIINGTDRAATIQAYAQNLERIIRASLAGGEAAAQGAATGGA